jgi:hypothetical protein
VASAQPRTGSCRGKERALEVLDTTCDPPPRAAFTRSFKRMAKRTGGALSVASARPRTGSRRGNESSTFAPTA